MGSQLLDIVLESLNMSENVAEGVHALLDTLDNESQRETAVLILAGRYTEPELPEEFKIKTSGVEFNAKIVKFSPIKEGIEFTYVEDKARLYCTPDFNKELFKDIVLKSDDESYINEALKSIGVQTGAVKDRRTKVTGVHTEEFIVNVTPKERTAFTELKRLLRELKEYGFYDR